MQRRDSWFYTGVVAVLMVVVGWQIAEHIRVRQLARAAMIGRGRDITTTLGLIISSQRRFPGIVSKERLQSSIEALVRDEVRSIALLNSENEIVVSSGREMSPEEILDNPAGMRSSGGEMWLANVVDLG